MKILVVEDEPTELLLLRRILEGTGYEVETAANGEAAWEIMLDGEIRLLITDWKMPGLEGTELIRRIREGKLPGYVYIILLTGKETVEDVAAGLNAGADDYIVKPVHPLELKARITVGERILKLEENLVQANKRLEHHVLYDMLTDLMDRRALYKLAQGEIERARRSSASLSIVFLDIDGFRSINEEHGTLVGDEVLKTVANLIREKSRPYDGIGRWAGDRFVIVLPGVAGADAENVAERILKSAASSGLTLPDGRAVRIRLSAGAAALYRVSASPGLLDELIQRAESALAQAKSDGGNQVFLSY
jgi:two-component system chemotaxis response regulator CheY